MKEKSTNTDTCDEEKDTRLLYETKGKKTEKKTHIALKHSKLVLPVSDGQFISICIWIH